MKVYYTDLHSVVNELAYENQKWVNTMLPTHIEVGPDAGSWGYALSAFGTNSFNPRVYYTDYDIIIHKVAFGNKHTDRFGFRT